MVFSPYSDVLRYGNSVVLYNFRNGKRLKVFASFYRVLKEACDNGDSLEQFYLLFENPNTRDYCKRMVESLVEKEILYLDGVDYYIEDIALTLKITDRCNLFCKHCCENSSAAAKELSDEEYDNVIDKIIEMKPKAVFLTGGEPMTRSNFREIVTRLRNSGVDKLCIMTNGTLINTANVDFLVSNFDKIGISVDGIDENTCSKIRGKNVFNKVINAVKLLQARGFTNIELSAIDTKYYTQEQFNEFCKSLNVEPLYRVFTAVGRGQENLDSIVDLVNPEDTVIEVNEDHPANDENFDIDHLNLFVCDGAYSKFFIDWDGEVYPCASFKVNGFSIGNITQMNNIHEYIRKREYVDLDAYKKFSEYFPKNSECGKCECHSLCFSCAEQVKSFSREHNAGYCALQQKNYAKLFGGEST